MITSGKQTLGPYELLAPIGAGGMGEVFRARDTRLNRDVAIKVLSREVASDRDRLRRFEQEIKTLAALTHPNVLTIHDTGVQDGIPYLVSELLDGQTLREQLSGGALPVRTAADYALQIAQGLAAAHGKGIIHRDLKPENIFVTKDGRLKILDFGLAKLQENFKSQTSDSKSAGADVPTLVESTEPGKIMGTPAYMSPEQVRGEAIDHRTDIFAFGCVLYETLSGTRAFRRDTPVESMHAILKEEPAALTERSPQFPPALERIVRRCLEKLPENRFQSAKDLAFALSEASTSELARVSGASRLIRLERAWAWKLIPALVVALTVAAVGFWRPWKKPAPDSGPTKPALTEAQKLTQRARALIDDNPLTLRENYRLAQELGQRAVQLDPADGGAWATLGRATVQLLAGQYDTSKALREMAKSQVERALSLAPDSVEAGLAMAHYLIFSDQLSEAEKQLRALLIHSPSDPRLVELLTESVWDQGRTEESMQILRDHANLPGGKAALLSHQAYTYFDESDLVEADALLDQIFADKPNAHDYLTRLLMLWGGWGDLKAAGEFLEKMPPQLLQEDAFVHHACRVWMDLGETEKALEVLRRTPRDFLEEWRVILPKGLLAGRVLQAAGRATAAQVEWRQALALVDQRLAAEPGRASWVRLKAELLGLLGEKAEGEKQFKLWLELTPPGDRTIVRSIEVQMALGNREAAIAGFEDWFSRKLKRWPMALVELRYDPLYAPLRSDPQVRQLITLGEGWLQEMRAARQHKQAGGSPSSTTADQKSLAVLPFVNMSPDKDNEYFSDGITEEILNALGRAPGLRVAARTSAFSFKGKNESVQRVGAALNVGAVLEGSVRKDGNKLRITAELINVADGFDLWSEEYDRDMTNIFAIQSEIAARVTEALKVQLLGPAAQARKPTENIEAYQLYLRGRQLWNRREEWALTQAVGLFNEAIAADPSFAIAYAALADCYVVSTYTNLPTREAMVRARAAALKAIELDQTLGEPHAALGMIQAFQDWDWSGAEAQLRRAIELNPNYATAHHWLGIVYEVQRRRSEAIAELQRAQALDPLSSIINSRAGLTLCTCGNVDAGIQLLQRHVALEPNWVRAHTSLALCYFNEGKLSEAIQEQEVARRISGEFGGALGFLYARAGRTNDALEVLRELRRRASASHPDKVGIALVEHGLGSDDEALDLLEGAVENRESELPWLAVDGYWKDLRPHQRVQAILRKMHLEK